MFKKLFLTFIGAISLSYGTFSFAALPLNFTGNNIVYFGDSLTDMGNGKADNNPTPDNPCYAAQINAPVTNPLGTGTFGGSTWANMTNFGFGACASDSTACAAGQNPNDYAVEGQTSIQVYNEQIVPYVTSHYVNPKTLYVIWVGANDLSPILSGNETIPQGVSNVINSIQLLYRSGARNFLIMSVPDISLTPFVQGTSYNFSLCIGNAHAFASYLANDVYKWNQYLFVQLNALKALSANLNIYYVDVNSLLDPVIANPTSYGFEYSNQSVWSQIPNNPVSPDKYLFFNYIHPTSKGHEVIAQYVRANASLIQ